MNWLASEEHDIKQETAAPLLHSCTLQVPQTGITTKGSNPSLSHKK
jgi:hypothetical protein